MMHDGDHSNEAKMENCVNGGQDSSTTSAYPWDALCDRILTASREGQDISVLQLFEELQVMPELGALVNAKRSTTATEVGEEEKNLMDNASKNSDSAVDAALEKLEFCWGRALLAAKRVAHDDDEHIMSIVDSFEQRLERTSEYLRCLSITADTALEVLQIYKLMESHVSADAVTAALHNFPIRDAVETRDLLDFLRLNDIPLSRGVAEQLEKHFVRRMKTEDAEDVFHEMLEAGVGPMSTRPYNLLFMKKTPFKHMDLLGYYEDMLDRGITPENSTFRILSRQMQHDAFANHHFGGLAWGNRDTQQQRPPEEMKHVGTQLFFAVRLEWLARTAPDTPLDTALQVLHRMDVEGTPLANGSHVLGSLLLNFCHPTCPDDTKRVLQLAQERGCYPINATLQKLMRAYGIPRFEQAEIVLQKMVEGGEIVQVDCVDMMRYFLAKNKRSKVIRVFRAFVVQWYRHPNERFSFTIASVAMKVGPFNWALGVLSIVLVTVDKPPPKCLQGGIRSVAHDARSRELLGVFNHCDWKRELLLLVDELQEQPFNGSSTTTTETSNNNSTNGGDTGCTGSKNHNRADGGQTWLRVMHLALIEMNVKQEVMEAYETALKEAIEKARRCQSHGGGKSNGGDVTLNSGRSRGK